MRLRASIHIGPLPGDADADGPAGIGKAMNDRHRLLDADPVRDALRHTDPDTTFVAAVISQRAYEDAIHSGACALPTSRLISIPVHVKQFTSGAWLYVPEPSGAALHRAFTNRVDSKTSRPLGTQAAADPEHALGVTASGTYLTTRHDNRLARQQARTACAAALLRWIHVVVTQRVTWDPAIAAGGAPLQRAA